MDVDKVRCGRLTPGGIKRPPPEDERFDWVDVVIPTSADVDPRARIGAGCGDEGISDFRRPLRILFSEASTSGSAGRGAGSSADSAEERIRERSVKFTPQTFVPFS